MDQNELKRKVAKAVLSQVHEECILGVGTGSTVNFFIDELPSIKDRIKACVSSSNVTTERLLRLGFTVLDLNDVTSIDLYIDGADEINGKFDMVKGGGGALTREKIVAEVSKHIICIADESKLVETLGQFPLPVEVIPSSRELVARRLSSMGGDPVLRKGFITDNGCEILDVHGLYIADPRFLESEINQIPGVVTVGIFSQRPADALYLATSNDVKIYQRNSSFL